MKNLKEIRKSKGFTQSRLAELVDVSYQQIQKYEKGKDSLSLAMRLKIARVLNLSLSEVLTEEELNSFKELMNQEVEARQHELLAQIKSLVRVDEKEGIEPDLRDLMLSLNRLDREKRKFIITATANLIKQLQGQV